MWIDVKTQHGTHMVNDHDWSSPSCMLTAFWQQRLLTRKTLWSLSAAEQNTKRIRSNRRNSSPKNCKKAWSARIIAQKMYCIYSHFYENVVLQKWEQGNHKNRVLFSHLYYISMFEWILQIQLLFSDPMSNGWIKSLFLLLQEPQYVVWS